MSTTTQKEVRAAIKNNSLPRLIAQKVTVELLLKSLEDIDAHGYDLKEDEIGTEEGRVKFMLQTFNSESYHWRTPQQKLNFKTLFVEYLQGLPFCSIPFENYRILELLKMAGFEAKDEDQEDEFIAAYWKSGGEALVLIMWKHGMAASDLINMKK